MQTEYTYLNKQRGISFKSILAVVLLLLLSSCTKDENMLPETPDVNNPCGATLRLDIGAFDFNGNNVTRGNVSGIKDDYVSGTKDENIVKDIWVFQYKADDGTILHAPVYIDNFDINDIKVDLTQNVGTETSLVCIVANVGEFTNDGSKEKWALDENGNPKEIFKNYNSFLKQAIPHSASKPFKSGYLGEHGGRVIPMFGISKKMSIVSKCYVSVPLFRMFARVEVLIDPAQRPEMEIEDITFHNIPSYCRIASLADTDGELTNPTVYPDNTTWTTFPIGKVNNVIIYLPENLQGIVSGMTGDRVTDDEKVPEHALYAEVKMSYMKDTTKKTYTYKAYFGFDNDPNSDTNRDFNIRRNRIYNLNINIKNLPE